MGVATDSQADVQQAMAETNARFCDDVLGRGQFDALSGVYTAGARVLPPGAPMVEGRAAIAEFWKVAVEGLGVTGATLKTIMPRWRATAWWRLGRRRWR